MPAHTARLSIPTPLSTEAPDGPAQMLALANVLDVAVIYGQGTLANRPTSTSGSPGIQGRTYLVLGDGTAANNGIVWWDTGTGWIALNRGAVGTSIPAINAFFPSTTPYDGAKAKLFLNGGAAGEANHVIALTYDSTLAKWVADRTWQAIQTSSSVTITGAEQNFPSAATTFDWIENYSDLYAAGLRPQGWVGGNVENGGSGQVRINYNIAVTDNTATGLPVVVTNLNAGASIANPTVATYAFNGWTDAVGVTAPSNRHGAIMLRAGNDAGGAATATIGSAVAKIRMVG